MNSNRSANKASPKKLKLKLFVLLILWVLAFFPLYPSLVETWLNHSNNSHGILVPLISAYLIWKKREELKLAVITNSNWGAIILVISLAVYVVSYAGAIAFISRFMIVFSLIGLVLFTLGKSGFKLLVFPLFFLIFMVPIPDSIIGTVAFPLQLFATKISAIIIQALSIPVYREGNMLYFVETQLETAEACSGIRSIVSLTMISVLFAYLSDAGKIGKAALVASAVPLALTGNFIRVSGTGILAHFYGSKVARGFLHEFSGLAVFALGFIILLIEYTLLNKIRAKG